MKSSQDDHVVKHIVSVVGCAAISVDYRGVGALDLFLEEDLEYARRLMRAGVPTELHVYPGAIHGFDLVAGVKVSQSFVRDQLDALRRVFPRS